MAASLSDLPVEIFDMIIDYMCAADHKNVSGRWDITNLRLVDRAIESKTKVRFAREGFHTLVLQVPIVWDERLRYVLDHPVFRNSVRCVTLSPNSVQYIFEEGPDKEHALDYLCKGRFRSEFKHIMEAHQSVTKLVLSSVGLRTLYSPFCEDGRKNEVYWKKMGKEVLAVLFTTDNVRLEDLTFDNSACQVPSSLLQVLPKSPTQLKELTHLRLLNFSEETKANSSSLSTSSDITKTLSDFMRLAPRLKSLQYAGGPGDTLSAFGLNDYRRLETFPSAPTLKGLTISKMAINGSILFKGLQACSKTLKSLDISKTCLNDLPWSNVFRFLRQNLRLDFFRGAYLMEESGTERKLSFDPPNRHRPLVMDSAPPRDYWQWELARRLSGSTENLFPTEEVEELIADGWALVSNRCISPAEIVLDAKEGDELKAWLEILESEATVVNW
jgi:hypothetical protein